MAPTHLSRRAFMATTAAATAAASTKAAPSERIRFGVLGCRNRGHQDAATFIDQGAELVTLCDCDTAMSGQAAERFKDISPQPRIEQDFRRVLDDKSIDAVVVAAPDHWHGVMACMALDAGKHVYLEKPATYCIDEGKAILKKMEQRPGLVVQVGTQHRGGPHFQEAKEFVQSGGLGKVAFSRCWITHDRGVLEKVPDGTPPASLDYDLWTGPAGMRPYNENLTHYNWHWTRENGTGEMGNWGAHWLDTARMLLDLDLPTAVSAHGGQFCVADAKQWPDTQTVIYEFPELTLLWELRLWTRFGDNGKGSGTELGGDKGSLVIDRGGWTFYPKKGEPVQHKGQNQEQPHVKSFLDAIKTGSEPSAPMVEGHKSAVMCHLGNIAADIPKRLEFDPVKQVFTNSREANARCSRDYRKPWSLG